MSKQDPEHEDCPLCCEELSAADRMYALHCPTASCNFNYCAGCIESMRKSASEGYQEASDGSRQVKVKVLCPQCRSRYQSSEKAKYSSEVIVQAVLSLREAHVIQSLLRSPDSNLSASELALKDHFVRCTSIESLEDSFRRLQVYHREIGRPEGEEIPAPDWDFLRTQLKPNISSLPAQSFINATTSASTANGSHHQGQSPPSFPWKDPTLFYGLDELMTVRSESTPLFMLLPLLPLTFINAGIAYRSRAYSCVVYPYSFRIRRTNRNS